ncbi:MAG TPA: hypothetical protein PKH28_10590 [Candidatus Competibacteraceae bacterium]|nr:MAG: hypothetical protein EKK69_03870 [Candidatus Competibacteraceae bacterium]HNW79350.1 hypothetical protein [Candidatus Competibacteraceae bacterium]
MTEFTLRGAALGLLLTTGLAGCASAPPPPKPVVAPTPSGALSDKARHEQQQGILKMRARTLRQLYSLRPQARAEIEQAAGYGVFEINGLNAVLADVHGRGVILDRAGGQSVYMQLALTNISPGTAIRPYWQVLVFNDPARLRQFVASGSPTDVSRDPTIKVYRLTEKGVTVQAEWGARYFRNPDLN